MQSQGTIEMLREIREKKDDRIEGMISEKNEGMTQKIRTSFDFWIEKYCKLSEIVTLILFIMPKLFNHHQTDKLYVSCFDTIGKKIQNLQIEKFICLDRPRWSVSRELGSEISWEIELVKQRLERFDMQKWSIGA